jgi:1-acyl-sn-glycerol-3-phosphate acyltransferase
MDKSSTSYPVRLIRFSRLLLHVVTGLVIVRFAFSFFSVQRRDQAIIRWANKLLSILNIHLELRGETPAESGSGCIIVANHISWLDIFLIHTVRPARFVAKSEIRDWPVVGWLCEKTGTLFIERTQRRHTAQINQTMRDVVTSGGTVGLFPEGTTSRGDRLKKLHSSLFQAAVEADVSLAPVAIRYIDEKGERSEAPAYVDETSLLQSLAQILAIPRLHAVMHFAPPIGTAGKTRRELTREAEHTLTGLLYPMGSNVNLATETFGSTTPNIPYRMSEKLTDPLSE